LERPEEIDAVDREVKRMLKRKNWKNQQRTEAFGGGELKRPGPKLGRSATGEEE
jgi:hypothetical protein